MWAKVKEQLNLEVDNFEVSFKLFGFIWALPELNHCH